MKRWEVMSHSQIGSSHFKSEKPNQDAYEWCLEGGLRGAISDGHGSDVHKYSEIGSKLAVDSAMEVIGQLSSMDKQIADECALVFGKTSYSPEEYQLWLCSFFSNWLPTMILDRWRKKVLEDYQSKDFRDDADMSRSEIFKLYGCTLLCVFQYEDFLVFSQIGDGLFGIYEKNGNIVHPIVEDRRHVNNATTSLSDIYADLEFKTALYPIHNEIGFISLTTDGVENAYPNNEMDYIYFYHSVHSLIIEDVKALNLLLERTSRYSGDDSTAIIFYNQEACTPINNEECSVVFRSIPDEYAPIEPYICDRTSSLFMGVAAELCDSFEQFELRDECVVVLSLQDIWMSLSDQKLLFVNHVLKPLNSDTIMSSRKLLANLLHQIFYKIYPIQFRSYLEPECLISCFEKAWINGGSGELSPKEWCEVVDEIRRIAHFDYDLGTFIFQDSIRHQSVKFVSQIGSYEIFYDGILYLHQIMKFNKRCNLKIGEIVTHPQNYKIWGVKNCSNHEWVQYLKGKDEPRYIPRGKVATISEGSVIYMYGIPIRICSDSSETH